VAELALSAPGPSRRGEPFQAVVHVDAEVLAPRVRALHSRDQQCCFPGWDLDWAVHGRARETISNRGLCPDQALENGG